MRKALTLILCAFVVNQALAKRLPPPTLLPVDDGVYRFVAYNEPPDHKHNPYQGGHVVAYLKATGEKIWEKYVFRIWVDSHKERDIQDVYLNKMYLDNPNLLVLQNEKGVWFVLDRRTGDYLKTQKFKKLEDDPSVYYTDGTRVEPILKGAYFIQSDNEISYGHQKVRAYDLPTGKVLWVKKVPLPRDGSGGRSHISFMILNDSSQLEITFEDGSEYRLDVRSGKGAKVEKE